MLAHPTGTRMVRHSGPFRRCRAIDTPARANSLKIQAGILVPELPTIDQAVRKSVCD